MSQYSDLACLLNVYQFWLDDLYPRAKFADGLAMIEKLGHSKRIQVMRREWINEGRPRERYGNTDVPHDGPQVTKVSQEAGNTSTATSANHIRGDSKLRGSSAPTDDDLYEASPPRQQPTANPNSSIESTSVGQASHSGTNNDIPKDDLDALLAEASTDNTRDVPASSASSSRPNAMLSSKKDDFDAEMEVMADMDDMW